MIKISDNLKRLSQRVFPLFVVGGFVRDSLMGQSSTDIDLAGSHTLGELINILGKESVVLKNKALGTAEILFEGEVYEYSVFRTEEYTGGKHNPKRVDFSTDIFEDARRRDFSCNAIYYDLTGSILKPVSGQLNQDSNLIDPYNGVLDIKNKKLRMIENSLQFDGVRILRMIRLSLNLGFEIEPETWAAAKKYASNLDDISSMTTKAEFEKINPQNLEAADEMLKKLKNTRTELCFL